MQESNIINEVQGTALPLNGNDIDTDRIIPARFLRCVTFDGLGEQVFFDERYQENGSPKSHPFNDQQYQGAGILIVNSNFGCGSSREHAPQAIMRFGIRAIIGESFAEIFAGNCINLGIPVLTAANTKIRKLQSHIQDQPDTMLSLDILAKTVKYDVEEVQLAMPESARKALLNGTWDTLEGLLKNKQAINEVYERLPYCQV